MQYDCYLTVSIYYPIIISFLDFTVVSKWLRVRHLLTKLIIIDEDFEISQLFDRPLDALNTDSLTVHPDFYNLWNILISYHIPYYLIFLIASDSD